MQPKPPLLPALAHLARSAVPLARAVGVQADKLEAAAAAVESLDETIGPVAFAVRDALRRMTTDDTDDDTEEIDQ